MTERLRQSMERNAQGMIKRAAGEVSREMTRHSLEMNPLGSYLFHDLGPLSSNKEVAEVLSEAVIIIDPALVDIVAETREWLNLPKGYTQKATTLALAAAKAKLAVSEAIPEAAKERLDTFTDYLFDGVGKVVSRVGRKKGMAVLATIAVGVTACANKVQSPAVVEPTPQSIDNANDNVDVEEPAPTPKAEQPTPKSTLPPESFTSNKSILTKGGYSVVEADYGWGIVSDKAKEKMVATAVSEEKIAINVNGETKEFSQEAFVPMILNGDTVYLLTIQENGENVDYFYLKETGEWVTPIEIQRNPEDIDAYTVISEKDVRSGRILYTHILGAEDRPFSSEAAVPQFIYYEVKNYLSGKAVVISAYMGDGVRGTEANNWTKWDGFYSVQESDKDPMVVGIQRSLNVDGESSRFQPIGFSEEWLRSEEGRDLVIEKVFIGTEKQWIFSPIVYFDGPCEYATIYNSQNPTCEFYDSNRNSPSSLITDFINRYEAWKKGDYEDIGVDEEGNDFQKMILAPWRMGFLQKQ